MGLYAKWFGSKPELMTPKHLGKLAEDQACAFLMKQGLKFVQSNFLCRCGEIDLIMLDNHMLVFVEVRYRKSSCFGSAVESVTFQKQKKLIRAAEYYLCIRKYTKKYFRFDIIAINKSLDKNNIEWIKNAFN